ncbi:MAG TPA: winged helix-turn-helix domain-containing protein [Candidatus Coprenecus pullicola]|nr:winged helix-turn-helix domain-containing protein [Candidatus Coprenecus pullicola]
MEMSINPGLADKMCDICLYLKQNPYSSTASVAEVLGVSVSSAKIYLRRLVEAGLIVPYGANKNRTYSLK